MRALTELTPQDPTVFFGRPDDGRTQRRLHSVAGRGCCHANGVGVVAVRDCYRRVNEREFFAYQIVASRFDGEKTCRRRSSRGFG